jgi:hypothetical protein
MGLAFKTVTIHIPRTEGIVNINEALRHEAWCQVLRSA